MFRTSPLPPPANLPRRFWRSKTGRVGLLLVLFLLLLSFVGGWLSPYGESQVFTQDTSRSKQIAAMTQNEEYRFVMTADWPASAPSQGILALQQQQSDFSAQGNDYFLQMQGQLFGEIYQLTTVATLDGRPGGKTVYYDQSLAEDSQFAAVLQQAARENAASFSFQEETFLLRNQKKQLLACRQVLIGLTSPWVFTPTAADAPQDFPFQLAVYTAAALAGENAQTSFAFAGQEYRLCRDTLQWQVLDAQEHPVADLSTLVLRSQQPLPQDLRQQLRQAYAARQTQLSYEEDRGQTQRYQLSYTDQQCTVSQVQTSSEALAFAPPSLQHPLGTDGNGMDIFTRLLYGGRISLLIGICAVLLETLLGMVIGGLAGYLGKMVDSLLMRLVDVVNCLPALPLVIIIGAAMDHLGVAPRLRLLWLILILAALSWPPLARLVRGQILSLRERSFMLAAEAAGISPVRRIFHHLLPNVAPQLILSATLAVGDVILLESALSFLGLGVKFPYASWGNMINVVSNLHVLTNAPWVWIPPGCCIILTVLGFHLIGDGLRDALDPTGEELP